MPIQGELRLLLFVYYLQYIINAYIAQSSVCDRAVEGEQHKLAGPRPSMWPVSFNASLSHGYAPVIVYSS